MSLFSLLRRNRERARREGEAQAEQEARDLEDPASDQERQEARERLARINAEIEFLLRMRRRTD